MATKTIRLRVYIDGFNLYYGAMKESRRYRWLDLVAFARELAPKGTNLEMVRYFTAPVDGASRLRQQIYLRALEAQPMVSIHRGKFNRNIDKRPLSTTPASKMKKVIEVKQKDGSWKGLPRPKGLVMVSIDNDEEKGSDVNLATYLMWDALKDKIDMAIVVSGDSDLVEPIRLCNENCDKVVDVVNPHSGHSGYDLKQAAATYSVLDPKILGACQFPKRVTAKNGNRLERPAGW